MYVRQNAKKAIFLKTMHFVAMVSIDEWRPMESRFSNKTFYTHNFIHQSGSTE